MLLSKVSLTFAEGNLSFIITYSGIAVNEFLDRWVEGWEAHRYCTTLA
jgi:hypothetical protein